MPLPTDNLYSSIDDNSLCTLVCKGNDAAFEEITHRYTGLIHSIAKEYSYPSFDSNDFMQLGLLGLYNACKAFSPDKGVSFKNFAAICIKRRYISLIRSLSHRRAFPNEALISLDEADDLGTAVSAETPVIDRESDKSFLELVKNRLSCMELCVLKGYISGMSYGEIAAAYGLDRKAVDNALQRIRKKLIR